LTKPFYIGIFEVTQKQWKNVMGRNPAYDAGDARPVETVSYNDIRGMDKGSNWPGSTDVDEASFCGLLRSRTAGFLWDLPTEAQWEFACRAGTTTALNSGKNLENEWNDKNIQNLGRVDCNKDDGKGGYKGSHTTVGSYRPNAWGLYDMHGNVWEWCRDRWMERLGYDPVVDPEGPPSSYSSYRLCRGGAWASAPKGCRSAARGWYYQTGVQDRERGFRLVIEL
jgi:formylglycine-generating enzyme required for sulfatase activity